MKLKLKESVIAGGDHYAPPAIIDTALLKISDAEAQVLVRRGTAEHFVEGAEQDQSTDQAGGPVVTKIETIQNTGADEDAGKPSDSELVEGRLAGLDDMKKDELVKLATEMGIETAGKTKPQLIEAIKAEPVFAEKVDGPAGGDDGAGEGTEGVEGTQE